MSREQDKKLYDTLTATGELLKGVRPVEGEEYSLESILAEFGKGEAKPAQTAKTEEKKEIPEKKVVPEETKVPEKRKVLRLPKREKEEKERSKQRPAPEEAAPREKVDAETPDRVSLKDVMSQTVDSVLAENEDGIIEQPVSLPDKIRDLLRRRKGERKRDTEQLWTENEATVEETFTEPEPDGEEADKKTRATVKKMQFLVVLSAIPTLVLLAAAILTELGTLPAIWWESDLLRCGISGGALVLLLLICLPVWTAAAKRLREGCVSAELGALIVALVCLGHCLYGMLGGNGQMPLTASAALGVWLCQVGLWQEAKLRRESFHLVNLGGMPLYLLTNTELGLCKQKGGLRGFYHTTDKMDPARKWQSYAVPFLLAAATILSGLVCFTGGGEGNFLLIWSSMLTAALPVCLSLTCVLPLYSLQHKLAASGATVAGYQGARAVSRSRRLILTDDDVFPPGTVAFNGYKVFGEERSRAMSYAASMAKAAGSQLHPLFEQQLAAEGGFHLQVEDFHFLEEGGAVGTIHGERVAMGSVYFMKKQHVALPHDLKLQTGVFLAVDGILAAIFVIKYQPSRNVEWALRALRRNHIRPVLAVRSGNVTPGLIKRKFGVDTHPIYPDITTRLALSDVAQTHGGKPNAVIYREGLMPLAEVFIGSKRLVKAVRRSTIFAYVAAVVGLLLTYYLTHAGNFTVLTPLNFLLFSLLWLIPTLLFSGGVKHY